MMMARGRERRAECVVPCVWDGDPIQRPKRRRSRVAFVAFRPSRYAIVTERFAWLS